MAEQYLFGAFTLDVEERRLSRGPTRIHLPPKAHDVLVALVRQAGRLVTKRELLDRVWPDAFVEEGILTVHVSNLRKALGDVHEEAAFIETIPRSGYRFIAAVTTPAAGNGATAPRERRPGVPPDARERRAAGPSDSPRPLAAYERVGRGRAHLLSASFFELPQAVLDFQAAIAIDPTYAAAHAGLALTRCAQAAHRAVPHAEAYADAKAAALRALAMDDQCADAQVALGVVLYLSEWDWVGAERSLQRALQISPNHTEAYLHYGSLMEALGRLTLGLQLKQQALERDPHSPMVFVQIATSFWNQRRYDEAIAWATRALELDPRHLLAREFLAGAYWKQGDVERLLDENVRQAEAFCVPEEIEAVKRGSAEIREAFRSGGVRRVTRYLLDHLPHPGDASAAIRCAVLYSSAGDLDAAFAHLDRAIDSHDPGLVHLAVAPQWDDLRGDPRFNGRLARMGLEPVW